MGWFRQFLYMFTDPDREDPPPYKKYAISPGGFADGIYEQLRREQRARERERQRKNEFRKKADKLLRDAEELGKNRAQKTNYLRRNPDVS